MFTLGTKEGTQSNRVRRYLDTKYMDLEYDMTSDDSGHVIFRFPTLDEEQFRGLVYKLKKVDGVTLMGVDDKLTEKQIMKLANLVEIESPDENNLIDDLKMALEKNRQMFNNPIFKSVSDIIRNYEIVGDEERMLNLPEKKITEQKLRKLIQNELKRIS